MLPHVFTHLVSIVVLSILLVVATIALFKVGMGVAGVVLILTGGLILGKHKSVCPHLRCINTMYVLLMAILQSS